MKQAVLDRIRVLNKYITNKIMIHLAGKRIGHLAILRHEGRKSGRQYRLPIIAEPFQDGFVIALTYGKEVDWYKNVKTQGGCSLRWKNKEYDLTNPRFIDPEIGITAFPALFRPILRKASIEYYLQLDIRPKISNQ